MGLGSPELPCYLGAEDEEMPLWDTRKENQPGLTGKKHFVASLPLPLPPPPPLLPPSSPPTFITKLIYRLWIQLTFPQGLHHTSHCARHLTSIELDGTVPLL